MDFPKCKSAKCKNFIVLPLSPKTASGGKNVTKGCVYKCAAEQKARSTYEYLIDLTDNPEVLAPLRFLREREIVHFQRFGEALEIARDYLNQQHTFFMQQNGCQS